MSRYIKINRKLLVCMCKLYTALYSIMPGVTHDELSVTARMCKMPHADFRVACFQGLQCWDISVKKPVENQGITFEM